MTTTSRRPAIADGSDDANLSVLAMHAMIMHEAISGSVLHEMPGAGHFIIFDRLAEIELALKGA